MTHTLRIAHSWDGHPLPSEEHATLLLTLTDDALHIEVDAPYEADGPPPGAPGPTDGLWSYEVVELFVVAPEERYTEIELSPHGHHWVLRLQGVRTNVETGIAIEWQPRIDGDRYRGTAIVSREHLPDGAQWCNAFRISGPAGQRRYRAHTPVPGEKPDFHRLHQFGPWPFAAVR